MKLENREILPVLSDVLTKLQALPLGRLEQHVFPELCRLCNAEALLVFQSVPEENLVKRIMGYSVDLLHPLMQIFRFEHVSHLCYRPCLIKNDITNPEVRETLLKQGDVSFFIYPVHLENMGTLFFYFSSKDETPAWDENALAAASKALALKLWGEEEKRLRHNDAFLLSTASHETRTQITAFLALAESLENRKISDEAANDIVLLRKTAEVMLQTLNSILDYGKIRSGRMQLNPVPFDIGECISSVTEIFSSLAKKSSTRLTFDLSELTIPVIIMDPVLLRQVIFNLVNNAIKVTPNGEVFVKASSDSANNTITITVSDTGPGIPPEIIKTLFDVYVQADPLKSKGTGLGLAISRNIIDYLGGTIKGENNPDGGAVFSFTIPCEPAVRRNSSSLPLNILIIDDDPLAGKLTETTLSKLGHSVTSAASGKEALSAVERHSFDVIFMDIHLDDFHAEDLFRKIVSVPNRSHIPVYAYTASGDPKERDACLKAGFKGVLIKPLPRDVFKDLLDHIGFLKRLSYNDTPKTDAALDLFALTEFKRSVDAESFENLTSEFLLHSYTLLNGINNAFMTNNAAELYRFSHNLKSSSKMFGLKRMSALARDLEEIGKAGRIPAQKTANLIKRMTFEYRKATSFLQSYLQDNK